jgi:hypothetical protein
MAIWNDGFEAYHPFFFVATLTVSQWFLQAFKYREERPCTLEAERGMQRAAASLLPAGKPTLYQETVCNFLLAASSNSAGSSVSFGPEIT